MNLHLNKDLNEIYEELLKFNPTSSILTRKSIETNSIFNNWIKKYLQVYQQLVMEFDPNKIKIKTKTKFLMKTIHNKSITIEIIIKINH